MKEKIRADSLSAEGDGVGSLGGLRVFIPDLLPGEEAEIELIERRARYGRGRIERRLTDSPDRGVPPCPLFGSCGGCQIMHLDYPAQLLAKRTRLIEALERIGHLHEIRVDPCQPSPSPLGYRHKIQLPILYEGREARLGLYRRDSHEHIPVESCAIHCRAGEALLEALRFSLEGLRSPRTLILRSNRAGQSLILLVTRGGESQELRARASSWMERFPKLVGVLENINTSDSNTILGPKTTLLQGNPYYEEEILDLRFRVSAESFFQVNPELASHLFAHALEFADLKGEERMLDAYAGVGLFALLAAKRAKEVIGIDVARSSIEDARVNARLNGLNNTTFYIDQAERRLAQMGRFDLVFLNPPRKGCEKSVLEVLCERTPKKILYLSCDPATLARDLALLAPHFAIERIRPFDMFPQTMHVESLALLTSR